MNWKLDASRFSGYCMKCGKQYGIGDPIAYRKNEAGYWERVHSGCLSLAEMQQRAITEMPLERTETARPSILEGSPVSKYPPVEESLELAVIALTEISKTLRAIEEKMRK